MMKFASLILVLLCAGCGMLHPGSSATPFGSTVTPPLPYAGLPLVENKVVVSSIQTNPSQPAVLTIPISWPADWQAYKWQVWGTGDLHQPMTLLVSNLEMTQRWIDVPGFGSRGFYECRTNGLVEASN